MMVSVGQCEVTKSNRRVATATDRKRDKQLQERDRERETERARVTETDRKSNRQKEESERYREGSREKSRTRLHVISSFVVSPFQETYNSTNEPIHRQTTAIPDHSTPFQRKLNRRSSKLDQLHANLYPKNRDRSPRFIAFISVLSSCLSFSTNRELWRVTTQEKLGDRRNTE